MSDTESKPEGPSEGSSVEIPEELQEHLAEALEPNEQVESVAEADLNASGMFETSWLVVTDRRVAVFSSNGKPSAPLVDVPLHDIHAVRRREQGGHSLLEVHTADRAIPLVRFTGLHADGISAAMKRIRERIEAERGPIEISSDERHWMRMHDRSQALALCPKCQRPLPRWSGGVCPVCLDKGGLILRLFGRAKRYWLPATGGLLLMLAITGLDMVQPYLQKVMIDDVIRNRDGRLLLWVIGGLALTQVVSAALGATRGYLMTWLGERVTFDLRTELYEHLQRLSLSYYDRKETGWIMDRVTSDTANLQDFLSEGMQEFLRDGVTLILIGVILFSMNAKLAFLTLLPSPLLAFLSWRFMMRSHRLFHWVFRKRSRLSMLLSNVIPGVRVVKAFAQEKREVDQFYGRSREYMTASVSAARVFVTFSRTIGIVTSLGSLIIWGYGGRLVIIGDPSVTVGTLVAFMSYLWRFYGPLQNLTRLSQRLQRAATAAQRVFEVMDSQPDVPEAENAREMPPIEGHVEYRDVTFGYDPSAPPVLRNISFEVQPGEMIGLVGPSGAGKSTTINLLCRFYDPQDGAILIDGIDIREVTLRSLRAQIGVVLQEPFLFYGTVAENIAYGKPNASMDEIIVAAQAANAHDFIMQLPEAYDTIVGERGSRLSGGERQRISIARAILKNPRILILDEATSSVDTETEMQIRQALDRLVRGRTTFAIAHRFSTLRNANRLIVLERGRIAEIGTHAELMAKEDGVFRRLMNMQQQMNEMVGLGAVAQATGMSRYAESARGRGFGGGDFGGGGFGGGGFGGGPGRW